MTSKRTTVNRRARTGRFVVRASGKAGAAFHVVRRTSGGWAVRQEGHPQATRVFATKDQAVSAARTISRTEAAALIIHRGDGAVQEVRRYQVPTEAVERPESGFGCARGLITLAPDFDEPLDVFSEDD